MTMFGCCTLPVIEDQKPLIIDVKKILSDRAWANFIAPLGFYKKLYVKKEKFDIEVPENFFVFEKISQGPKKELIGNNATTSNPPPPENETAKTAETVDGQVKTAETVDGQVKTAETVDEPVKTVQQTTKSDDLWKYSSQNLANSESMSLNTIFDNNTAEKQLYKFRFEKTRRTEINVTFQKGFTFGGKANFSIGVPKLWGEANVGAELEMQYQISKTEGQTFEETVLMEATSDIAVGPNSKYTANVELEEKSLHVEFEVITRLSMPQKQAPVYIKRKTDGECVFVYYINNLRDIFRRVGHVVRNPTGCKPYEVYLVTEGVIKGMIACNHKILLNSNEPDELKKKALNRFAVDDD
ncbi:uncharacterized protein LOC131952057 [Physella acuta]|uniref:uncharacterized protein LOC131952057 n=1 Tax=Physella acuta TaxID=109671 RepID=UPI0027DAF044|nr:uncharacterized protein LOC131952057 [Physella acuta]